MADLSFETAPDVEGRLGLQAGSLGTALIGLLGRLPAGLCIHEAVDGRCLFANKTMADLFGRKPAQIVGHQLAEWLDPSPRHNRRIGPDIIAADQAPRVSHSQTLSLRIDGRLRHFSIYQHGLDAVDQSGPPLFCSIWLESSGTVAGIDVAETVAARAVPDSLYLLSDDIEFDRSEPDYQDLSAAARRQFDDRYRRAVDTSARNHCEFAIALVCVDRLAPELARHGAQEADRAIALIVDRLLLAASGAIDAVLQLDAARFITLFAGAGLATAHGLAERLVQQCAAEAVDVDGASHPFTVSIGVASFPHTAQDQRKLLAAAAAALNDATRRGGNQVAMARIQFDGR